MSLTDGNVAATPHTPLEPSPEQMRAMADAVVSRSIDHLARVVLGIVREAYTREAPSTLLGEDERDILRIAYPLLFSNPAERRIDEDKLKHQHISMAKRNNVWMALECARMSRDILGANGVADEYPIFRHMANLESVKTYEGTHDIHTLIIGQSVTGIDAF